MAQELQSQINKIVKAIASNYNDHPDTIPLDSRSLPNRKIIIETIHLLRELLFPGYFGKQLLNAATIEYYIGDLIVSIREKLREQIVYALKHEALQNRNPQADIEQRAENIILAFLGKIPELRNILATDVQSALDGDPAAEDKDEIIFSYPGIFAISVYRLAHELYLLKVPLIPRIMAEYAHSITGIDIHAGAQIGTHFFIDHGTGVVIGNRVKLYQGVTLGALSTKGGQVLRGVKRHPTIEDDVTVYSGASILGGETIIGQGVVIGSNVFITKSVPDRTKVSVKNPELLFKGHGHLPKEFEQEFIPDWSI